MRSIFIGSTGGEPGQTLATWALAIRLREKGLQVGFFKPYGLLPDGGTYPREEGFCDSDVALLKQVLGLSSPDEVLCPITLPAKDLTPEMAGNLGEELMEKIREAFLEISRDKDIVLIMGAKEIFFGGGGLGLSDSHLVKLFDTSVLLVDRYQRDNLTFYSLLSLNSFLDGRVKTAILNHTAPDRLDHIKAKVVPFLKEKGLKSVVAVPEDPILAGLTVSTIAELIEGKILCCSEMKENLVHTSTIGSNYLEGSLSIFKQVYNKVILLGLDAMEAPGKPVVGIILTGGKNPSELVLKAAGDRPIPLILTRADTFQVMERLEKARPALRLSDEFKVRRFLRLIDQEMGPNRWVEDLL
ncbi:MAG TPA: AAA family ATPase [Thermodesulfobacteriota bacterium]|nr:AAA family ATPase [Thermodesulfobacteriota bacterium]